MGGQPAETVEAWRRETVEGRRKPVVPARTLAKPPTTGRNSWRIALKRMGKSTSTLNRRGCLIRPSAILELVPIRTSLYTIRHVASHGWKFAACGPHSTVRQEEENASSGCYCSAARLACVCRIGLQNTVSVPPMCSSKPDSVPSARETGAGVKGGRSWPSCLGSH